MYSQLLGQDALDVHAMCGLSRCLGRLGRWDAALALAERAVRLSPDEDWPHRLRSAHLLQLGRRAEALRAAREAVRINPTGLPALLTLFEAAARSHDRRGAAAAASRLLALHPDSAESHNCAGRAAMLRRRWTEAEAAFRQALRAAPGTAVYHANLAAAVERQGRRAEALRLFQSAVRTDPADSAVRARLLEAVDRRMARVRALAAGTAVAGPLALAGVLGPTLNGHAAVVALAVTLAPPFLAAAALVGFRRLRLGSLDEPVRRFYAAERRWLLPRRSGAAVLGGLVAVTPVLLAADGSAAFRPSLPLTALTALAGLAGAVAARVLGRRQLRPRPLARRDPIRLGNLPAAGGTGRYSSPR